MEMVWLGSLTPKLSLKFEQLSKALSLKKFMQQSRIQSIIEPLFL